MAFVFLDRPLTLLHKVNNKHVLYDGQSLYFQVALFFWSTHSRAYSCVSGIDLYAHICIWRHMVS
jgi:hypothetical protein